MDAEIGIIGGSGLYNIPGLANRHEETVETPWGSPSDAYVLGELGGRKVAFLARHGRGHRIMPSNLNFRANLYGLKKLGVQWVLSFSAVGSLQEQLKPLDFCLPDQFFDRTRGRVSTFFEDDVVVHIGFSHPICSTLADVAEQACNEAGRDGPSRRDVLLHGRPGVFDLGRIEPLPLVGARRDRHDELAGG